MKEVEQQGAMVFTYYNLLYPQQEKKIEKNRKRELDQNLEYIYTMYRGKMQTHAFCAPHSFKNFPFPGSFIQQTAWLDTINSFQTAFHSPKPMELCQYKVKSIAKHSMQYVQAYEMFLSSQHKTGLNKAGFSVGLEHRQDKILAAFNFPLVMILTEFDPYGSFPT